MCAKIESERLLYIQLNQRTLRVDQYAHLRDAVMNEGNVADIVCLSFQIYWRSQIHARAYSRCHDLREEPPKCFQVPRTDMIILITFGIFRNSADET
ncbi:hypothetical protein AVEN_7420-1 [Araneus ventricosus]|uniref:Helitron helicase-like domain-containing protein n=1 Tax=Araneus ventricosus TaxID=182803 RepID=A0A4Y2GZ15_ARAVE|nr:hypothetical protein AVEN_7420-1 [Araneus ventricosus]